MPKTVNELNLHINMLEKLGEKLGIDLSTMLEHDKAMKIKYHWKYAFPYDFQLNEKYIRIYLNQL